MSSKILKLLHQNKESEGSEGSIESEKILLNDLFDKHEVLNEIRAVINLSEVSFDNGIKFYSSKDLINQSYPSYPSFIDLGYKYSGMGWIYVLSWSKLRQNYFFRLDGGSNDHDRLRNLNFFNKFDISNPIYDEYFFDSLRLIEILSLSSSFDEDVFKNVNVLSCN